MSVCVRHDRLCLPACLPACSFCAASAPRFKSWRRASPSALTPRALWWHRTGRCCSRCARWTGASLTLLGLYLAQVTCLHLAATPFGGKCDLQVRYDGSRAGSRLCRPATTHCRLPLLQLLDAYGIRGKASSDMQRLRDELTNPRNKRSLSEALVALEVSAPPQPRPATPECAWE